MQETDIQIKKQKKIEEVVRAFAQRASEMDIQSNIPLNADQLKLLKQIYVLAINRSLSVPEVMKDPRKLNYYTNYELKLGVVAILMTHVLTNHLSQAKYTEDFFLDNIIVYTNQTGTAKHIDLKEVEDRVFQSALNSEIVYDWIIYRSPGSRGIRALSDEKTQAQGLKNFASGLSPVSEFSRFERKYFEEVQKNKKESTEFAQRAFRAGFVRQVAEKAAKQLLKTQDPMNLAKLLFNSKNYEKEIQNMLADLPVHAQIQQLEKEAENMPIIQEQTKKSKNRKHHNKQKALPKPIALIEQKTFEKSR